jgi:hypothetical protein
LIFINDIADDMLGLCRMFADDTSDGERSLEINHLRSMVNIDLNNITHWAKQWLVKLNPEENKNSVLQYQALSRHIICNVINKYQKHQRSNG